MLTRNLINIQIMSNFIVLDSNGMELGKLVPQYNTLVLNPKSNKLLLSVEEMEDICQYINSYTWINKLKD